MSRVIIQPSGNETWDAIGLHHDFECPLKDAEVSFTQTDISDPESPNADIICFHPDRIPALIDELTRLQAEWKEASRPLLRDVPTAGEW
jgi:hypothetical protein